MNDGDGGPKLLYNPHIFVCLADKEPAPGRGCCADKGVRDLFGHMRAYAKQNGVTGIRINQARCLDRCELGPIMVVYPEGVWYTVRTKEDAEEIVRTHIIGGGRVDRLLVQPADREVARAEPLGGSN
ncbi:MAG: (2Fe-2S) ferredoxin domain-containing protein [Alphaproteobacteria bacterium]|nr:(2Fe-2S) ferredoxin domain-containing protein [Alphaproteobacteria bacterium]